MASYTALLSLLLIFYTLLGKLFFNRKARSKLPPGPRLLPVIGNLHLLGKLPHRDLAKLAQKHGPIMSIKLGQVPVLVLSSPQSAELVLKQHDAVFSGRPSIEAWLYGSKGIAFAPYGDYWRRVRKMCMLHLLTATKIAEFEGLRRGETQAAMRRLEVAAMAREAVDVDAVVGELVENIMFTMVVGKEKEGNRRLGLRSVVGEGLYLGGLFNLADFIPILKRLDLQGITKKLKNLRRRADEIFDEIIEDHLKDEELGKHKDILGTMLDLMNNKNEEFTSFGLENVKAIIFELFAGGIETTLLTTTWALSALIKNPRSMRSLQKELDLIIGRKKIVKESDLPNLSYLDKVIKETLRLHSIGPMLIPHESTEDIEIEGYMVPKKSRIIVNAWAIGHDPKVWSQNVEEFYPERFSGCEIDLRGHHFELLPFGSGRRGCPGMQLGLTSVKLILAQLVHCFDWELPNGMQPKQLDMTEKFGLSTPRAHRLLAVPSSRLQVAL